MSDLRAGAGPNRHDTPDVAAQIDGLLATRLRKLQLPPNLQKLYKDRNDMINRRMAASWCIRVAWVNALVTIFDVWIIPAARLPYTLALHLLISGSFVISATLMRQQKFRVKDHVLVITPCIITMIAAGLLGLLGHSTDMFLSYLTMGIVIVFIAMMFVHLKLRHAIWLGSLSLLILSLFMLRGPIRNPAEYVQIVLFFTCSMASIMEARRIQNIYQYRMFLLQTREELRMAETSRRNEQLSSLAYTDRLTDVPNRRYFDEMADTINAQPDAYLPLSVCLFDIDHFKNLNDKLGHLQGDRCLRLVATCLRGALRNPDDVLARYGGEEFVLMLPRTDQEGAQMVAEDIRAAVLALAHPNPGAAEGYVTISAGIATSATADTPVEALLAQADDALYRAKAKGRDRVCV